MERLVEIRILNLRSGAREEFHRLYVERALPLLLKWKMDVVAYGPSHHDDDTFYVIRSFGSTREREDVEETYYASADWREGPREAILALIDNYHDVVLEVDDQTIDDLRNHPSQR